MYDGEDANTPGDAKQEDETKQTFHVRLQGRRPGLVDNQGLSAVLMNLVDRYTEKVEICSNDEEDWDHEGEDKVDVVVQPTVITRETNIYKKLEFVLILLYLKP